MRNNPILQVRCAATIGHLRMNTQFSTNEPWTVIFGPSGSGKSSLLRLIAGTWRPRGGSVYFRGHDITEMPAHLRRIGFVAQEPALFPHLDVLGNVRFGAIAGPVGTAAVEAELERFDLRGLRRARTNELSGGERQRVALARALAAQPRALLLDEVFTGMHLAQRDELLHRVAEHCANAGIPVLSVTHDVLEASLIAGEVIKLKDGCVRAHGAPGQVLAAERESLRQALLIRPTG